MRALFLDCISGISGDMMVGALVDLGVKPSTLEWELSKISLGDFHLHFDRQKRKEIEGVKFTIHEGAVHTHDQDEPAHSHEHSHSHDDEHEHEHHHHEDGTAHSHSHEHPSDHGHEQEHEHGSAASHSHGEHEHSHAHGEHACCNHDHDHQHEPSHGRSHSDIQGLIENSDLSVFVKKRALGIFHRIADAEGKIHGVPPAEVHFHEVGALDSIADIVMTCIGLESLGVEQVFASSLHEGHGTVECAHGTFPVPAPATLEILRGIPLGQIDEPHELITPTGAAILAEFAQGFGQMPTLKLDRIGYGIGTRELATRPNVLRAVLGDLQEA